MEYNIVFSQKIFFTNVPNEAHMVPQCAFMKQWVAAFLAG